MFAELRAITAAVAKAPASSRRKAYPSSRTELFRQHQKLARAGDPGPVAVKVRHQPFQIVTVHRLVQRGLVGELIGRLMLRGIAEAPKPPGLFDAERFCRVRKMLLAVPRSK